MIDSLFLITSFTTLFVVVDPLGLAPIFMTLTQGMSPRARFMIGLRACLIAGFVLTIFAIFGQSVLTIAGISMPAFRIAGGILLLLTALDMLFERRSKRRETQADEPEADDPSVFPLAIPLIAGPGAIATMILQTGDDPSLTTLLWVLLVMVSVLCICFLLFMMAGFMERLLGKTGINIVTRVFGMLLAALAVQFILDGIQGSGLLG